MLCPTPALVTVSPWAENDGPVAQTFSVYKGTAQAFVTVTESAGSAHLVTLHVVREEYG